MDTNIKKRIMDELNTFQFWNGESPVLESVSDSDKQKIVEFAELLDRLTSRQDTAILHILASEFSGWHGDSGCPLCGN